MRKHSTANGRVSRQSASIHASGASSTLRLRKTWPISLCIGLVLGSVVVSGDALAGGPTGGVVVGGSGTISQNGNQTVINQATNRLALNWQTFNVGANESVLFNQPSRSAVALNRILDQNPSQIFGRINSNGQVFLINTHGIIFGATAQMNVGGLLASTLDLTPDDFLAGRYNVNLSGASAGVVNHGLIRAASGGSVSLVGGSVLNDGLILADYGKINLDGADHAVLDFDGDGLINIQITGELKQRLDNREAAVANHGTLSSEGGTVVLQASAAKDLFTNLVNNTGVVDASGISTDGGVVRLVGTGGDVASSGTIDASGVHGGSVQLLSDRNVGVTGGSITASGTLGGGSVRVGGGWQGGEGLQTAAATYIAPDARLAADATRSGNGGSVVVWGDHVNNFYGSISARGGALGGDGGRVETSSHDGLNAQGHVDAAAPHGVTGKWLLDPRNAEIVTGGTGVLNGSNVFSPTSTVSKIDPGAINSALTGGTSVYIFTNTGGGTENGDITVTNGIQASGTGSLYLQAAGSIFLNNNIAAATGGSNPLSVFLWANYGGAAGANAYIGNAACAACRVIIGNTASASITTAGGSVDVQTGTSGKRGGALQLGTSATVTGSIDTSATTYGTLNVNATGIAQQSTGASAIKAGAATLNAGAGTIALGNSGNQFTGAVSLNNSGANDVVLNNGTNALSLGASSVGSGQLTASGAGITQTGALAQAAGAGAATFNAGANAITLASASNSFTGAVSLTGSNVSLVNNGATQLGTGTVTGTLDVASNGALSQTGALTVNGAANFTQNSTATGSSQDLDLGSQANDFKAGVTFAAGTGAQINNLALKNIDATPGTLTLPANVDGNLTLNYTNAALAVPVVGVGGNLDLTATGITINGNVTTAGSQSYNGAVTLASDATLTSSGGNAITLASTVDGAHNLSVATGGQATFGGAVGASTALTSLTTNAGGSTSLGGNVTTTGAQHYNDAVTLAGDVTLASSSGAVNFADTVDGAHALTVNSPSSTTFGGDVGSSTALTSLALGSGAATQLGGNVTTTGAQVYTNAVTLAGAGAQTLTGGAISFGSTLDGAQALTVNASGATIFGGAIGSGTALTSLTTGAGGSTSLGGNVTTSGAQTYNDAVTLTTDTTLTSSGSGAIKLASTVNGAHQLTVATGGLTTFGGAIGASTALTSLTTDAGGSTSLGGNVTTAGAQSYNDAVTLAGNATLTSSGGAIAFGSTLDGARNLVVNANGAASFGGAIGGATALGSLTTRSSIFNATDLTVSGGLSVTTTAGAITQTGGAFIVGGASSFNAGANAITLANAANHFTGAVTLTNSGANAVALANGANPLLLGTSSVGSGTLALSGNGIAQSGASTFTQAAGAGATSLNAGSGALALANANDFSGAISATGQGVAINDISNLTIASLSSGTNGAVSLTAGGILSLPASGIATGSADLTLASNGGALATPGDLSGANVSLTGRDGVTLANNVTASGNLALTGSNAAIVQTGGVLVVGGTSSVSAGTGDITLTAGNDFTGAVGLLGGATRITDTNALTLGTLGTGALTAISTGNLALGSGTVGGNLNATSNGGAISQAGALAVTGGSTINAGAGAIALAAGGNHFTGAVTLTNSGANAVALANGSNPLLLGTSSVGSGTLALSGNGIAQSGASTFTQAAGAGATSLNAGSGALALGNANDFTGAISATGQGVAINDISNLTIASLNSGTNGAVSLTAGGILSLPASGIATGSADLTLASNGGALATPGNLSGANISLTGRDGITLGNNVTASGNLALASSNAAIMQTGGALVVAGASGVNAGSGTITLAAAGNDFTGAVGLGGGTTQITDTNALTLGTLGTGALTAVSTGSLTLGSGTVNGNLNASSNGGAISQTGALAVTGNSAINAGSGNITLAAAGNDFTGAVGLVGGSTQITDTNALVLGTLGTGALTAVSTGNLILGNGTVNGNLNASSNGGAISQTGALAVTGSSAINAGAGAIALGAAGNHFTGVVTLTNSGANAVALANGANPLLLGTSSVGSGTLALSGNGIAQSGASTFTQAAGAGATSLNAGSGALALGNANDFSGAISATGQGVAINDISNLTIASLNSGANGAVSLTAGGILSLPTSGIATGSADLTLTSNGGALATPGDLSGANVSLTGRDGVTLGNNVTASGVLALTSQAAINQTAGTITAASLAGNAAGDVSLNQANAIGALNAFSAANFSLTNGRALAVNGPLTTVGNAGSISLATTSGDLTIATDLTGHAIALTSAGELGLGNNLSGASVTLSAGGNIAQTAGTITAGALGGSSVGSTALGQANHVGRLNAFSTGSGFQLRNAQALDVTGTVTGGSGAAGLGTSSGSLSVDGSVSGTSVALDGAAGLVINGTVQSGTGTTTLTSAAGAITEGAGGSVAADLLVGHSASGTALVGANQVATLGSFSSGGDFSLNNVGALTISAPLAANGGASNIALSTNGTAADLLLAADIHGSNVKLTSGRDIKQTSGSITGGSLTGASAGTTTLNGPNHVGTLGSFNAANFSLVDGQALVVNGPLATTGGNGNISLATTAGKLTVNSALAGNALALVSAGDLGLSQSLNGKAVTLTSGGNISQSAGTITATTLTGSSAGSTTLEQANAVAALGDFKASNFSLGNARSLGVTGSVDGGAGTKLATTAGDLAINGQIKGTTTTLNSAGTISEGAGGSITANQLTGRSTGAATLNGSNHVATLGSFSGPLSLTTAQSLAVTGPVSGGANVALTTTTGDLLINGAISGKTVMLTSAGALSEGAGGSITAATLSGRAVGPTLLGSATQRNANMVDTLGNFSSKAGFSMTNGKTLTLASVNGSAYTVDAGTSAFYLSVVNGSLFQLGITPLYDGLGTFGSTGRMGASSAPIYVIGTGLQTIANVGQPPAYFNAVDSQNHILPLGGGFAINVPTASGAGSAQNNNHGDSYIDPSVITANYRSYGIVPSGVRLPADQQNGCDPDQPDQNCQDGDALGMVWKGYP